MACAAVLSVKQVPGVRDCSTLPEGLQGMTSITADIVAPIGLSNCR